MPASTNNTPRAWIEDGKLYVTTRFNLERVGLIRSLPDARWNDKRRRWTITPTPCTAAKLIDGGIPVDDEITDLAMQWNSFYDVGGALDYETLPLLFKTDPWNHQNAGYWFAEPRPAAYLGMDMGTGKSMVAVLLAANSDAKQVLVVCPKSVIGVWPREFEQHSPIGYDVICLDAGLTKKNVQVAKEAMTHRTSQRVVFVINYESFWRKAMAKWLLSQDWDYIIADELHRCKSANGKASKFLYEVGKKAKRRLGLSGTPLPHSALDAYGQYRFLDAGIFGTSYVRFRSQYARCSERYPSQVDEWINQDEFKKKLHSIMFQVKAADVLDLPPILHEQRFCELSKPARKLYDDIEADAIANLADCGYTDFEEIIGRKLKGEVVADHAFTQLLRLQQIASGHVSLEETVKEVDRSKAQLLQDILVDIPHNEPVCVFTQYRHNLKQIAEVAEITGRKYGEISGSRKDLTDQSTMPEGIELMGVQWQSGAVGIDLTRSRYALLYTPTFNWGNFQQGLKRQHRPGQKRPVVVISLIVKGTIDHMIYAALRKREKEVSEVLSPQGEN